MLDRSDFVIVIMLGVLSFFVVAAVNDMSIFGDIVDFIGDVLYSIVDFFRSSTYWTGPKK